MGGNVDAVDLPLIPAEDELEVLCDDTDENRPFSARGATNVAGGFDCTNGGEMGEGVEETGDLTAPPMASYRRTMSEIDVRRMWERGLGSSGGDRVLAWAVSDCFEGKTNIDCGRADRGEVGVGALLLRGDPEGCCRPEFGGESAELDDAGLAVETDANAVDRRFAFDSTCC